MPTASSPQTRDDFALKFSLSLVYHLGLNLYSEVHTAISELVANGYDADAPRVTITLPVGEALGEPNQVIVVEDTGHGMKYEDARDFYLAIGANRRKRSRTSRSGKRKVVGRKGIGKLAGFGVANVVHVRSVANGNLTEFEIKLSDMEEAPPVVKQNGTHQGDSTPEAEEGVQRSYKPTVFHANTPVEEPNGTIVTLKELRTLDEIDFEEFVRKLTRKFGMMGDEFEVIVRDSTGDHVKKVERFEIETQFRFPEAGWNTESIFVPGLGSRGVRSWIGFTEKPIQRSEFRGVAVLANGKSVQEPFFFEAAGGSEGQLGLQYVTGEVEADWLDDLGEDVIASDRSSVRWSDKRAHALLKWGKDWLKASLKEWVRLRREDTIKEVEEDPELAAQIQAYPGPAQRELRNVLHRVGEVIHTASKKRRAEVFGQIVTAYQHEHVAAVLKSVVEANSGWEAFAEALKEWDVVDAVLTYQELANKRGVLDTFRHLVLGEATEVKSSSGNLSMHELMDKYPWLLDPMHTSIESERHVDKYLLERYGFEPEDEDESRFDFIVHYDAARIRLVEIKSAKDPVDLRGLQKLQYYRKRIKDAIAGKSVNFRSILVFNGKAKKEAQPTLETLKDVGDVDIYTWNDLMTRNETIYQEMLARVKSRAPDDPRVVNLAKVAEAKMAKATGTG